MSESRGTLKAVPTARDIMSSEPVCAEPSTTIRQLARLFEENEISGCPVVDAAGKVVGVVSKTDLIRRCSEGTVDLPPSYLFEILGDPEERSGRGRSTEVFPEPLLCVQDFMTESAVTVHPTMPAHEIAALLVESRIHRAVVVDAENFPVGMITTLDLLKVFPRPGR